ncbi:translation initiation factor IF-2 [Amphiplicatus metriothermophilus]|uniref:Translation initiation factor IF-2 n=1 Tax=Amphiplicatus metriothermophilus TaxID=1519374 RepID=A0A239PLD0_9PROT|nr:translation initiation factor IF-2 [Amphiplicatus metriothermophilus]MBB5517526.1 translation initiation factor IF-2 [Amphiplicatus metriothermophilus]SNT68139.1 bacterial translation initiation factor 2 (bIF-2) [Amphiplicatus metriothermophilus]
MSDDVDTKTEAAPKTGRRPLSLRRTERGAVKQSFSHGRTKTVVVETKRRRGGVLGVKKAEAGAPEQKAAPKARKAAAEKAAPEKAVEEKKPAGAVLRTLSEEEKQARAAALIKARQEEAERRKREEAERAEREAREAEERRRLEEDRQRQAEEEERRRREAEARQRAEEEARQALEEEERERKKRNAAKAEARGKGRDDGAEATVRVAEADNPLAQLGGRLKTKRKLVEERRGEAAKTKEEPRRRTGKLTISNALDDDERQRSLASVRRAREREKLARQQRGERQAVVREVVIPETITVQELAQRMAMRAVDLVKELMKQGQMVTANATLDADTAELIAVELGHSVKRVAEADIEEGLFGPPDDPADMKPRPPVVTVMGHVDHGKTSLLDALRQTDVVAREAGGITQHIGAYQVELEGGRKITFLDTPGHAAFTQMRARGAQVTDIVVLVVAADDSIMPQTVEAISHARAAGVPIIVAINKIDRPDADPQRVRTDLLQHEIQVESLGGDVQDVEVSALKKQNLDGLLEAILLQAELLELKANPDRAAEGSVVEARLDKGRGPVATFLIQRGALKRGDVVVVGSEWGKIRALIDERGQQLSQALPAQPVEVLGLDGVPEPGDRFAVVESEARAREIAEYRQRKKREKASAKTAGAASLEQMMAQLRDAEIKELPLVIKGDVQGSVEAIVGSLDKLSTDEVRVRILHTGVGGVSESDVILAGASGAPVIGFNVRANKDARERAQREGVEIRYYSIIYELIDDIKGALTGMLEPELRETFLGNAEILEVFNISKVGKVAGCRVTEGVVRRGAKVRLIRDDTVIHEGELSQLKRFKDDVNEVVAGQECGMSFANYDDLKQGDVIECFSVEKIKRTL